MLREKLRQESVRTPPGGALNEPKNRERPGAGYQIHNNKKECPVVGENAPGGD